VTLQRDVYWIVAVVGASIWLWPFTDGPSAPAWPTLYALAAGLLVLNLLVWYGSSALHALFAGWLIAASLSAVIALMQYFNIEDALFPLVTLTPTGRAHANTRQVNHLATLLAIGILIAIHIRPALGRALPWLLVLLVTAMAATVSRTGAVHLIIILVLAMYWPDPHKRKVIWLCAYAIALYAIAALVLPPVLEYLVGTPPERSFFDRWGVESTCSSRRVLWGNVLELIAAKPLTGWGFGELTYAHYAHLYNGERFCDKLTNAHNLPLHLAVELGIPIAAALLVSAGIAVGKLKLWRERDPKNQVVIGILILVLVHSLLEFPLWFGNFQTLMVFCVWALWVNRESLTPGNGLDKTASVRPLLAVSVFIWAAIGYAAWDYHRVSQLYTEPEHRSSWYKENTFEKAKGTWLYSKEFLFGQVTTTTLTQQNAAQLLKASEALLHYSPEPRIIERVIESSLVLSRNDSAQWHMERYRRAWPNFFEEWRQEFNARQLSHQSSVESRTP
jgi:O-antigen ligase